MAWRLTVKIGPRKLQWRPSIGTGGFKQSGQVGNVRFTTSRPRRRKRH